MFVYVEFDAMKQFLFALLCLVAILCCNCQSYRMRACTGTGFTGTCVERTSPGSYSGSFSSYTWTGDVQQSFCLTVCNGSTNLGQQPRCLSFSNNSVVFTRFIIDQFGHNPSC